MGILKVVAPMAGITDGKFLCKVIPYGFNVATLGGYSLDEKTINASAKIIKRGRREFHYPLEDIFNEISSQVSLIKDSYNVKVSANVRATTPEPIIKAGNIEKLDIIEINCHCRQEEILAIGCGQKMLERDDLGEFISAVADGVKSEVSVKIRGNYTDTLKVAGIIEDAGADYLHVDAMKRGVPDADYDLVKKLCDSLNIGIIGNNSINSIENLNKMIECGVDGFSIGRAVLSGRLNFKI